MPVGRSGPLASLAATDLGSQSTLGGEVTKMRSNKLILATIVALAMAVVLAACGGGSGEEGGRDGANAPEQAQAPEDTTLKLTVPKMANIKDDTIPYTTGDDEQALKEHAGIHLDGTGHPWEQEANVYIAGHRLGYEATDSWLAFWDIDALEDGDEVLITDANGTEDRYEVFEELVVAPTDLYVAEPLEGRNIVSLQSCTLPDYSERVIVRAELKRS